MTALISPDPVLQFFGPNGQFLAGGLLYTYAAGTTTPQATYVDYTQLIPNTNPIVLGPYGQANVWLTPGQAYKFNLTDSLGNPIPGFPVDQINAGSSGIASNLVPSTGSTYTVGAPGFTWANGYFDQLTVNGWALQSAQGLGYIARTANEILAAVTPTNYFYAEGNALRYGADPTGVASSFIAIQQTVAVACAGALPNGVGNHARIYFPHGNYLIDSDNAFGNPLGSNDPQRGIIVYGDGMMSSMLQISTGGTKPIWLIDGPANEQQYISLVFMDIGIQGDLAGAQNHVASAFNMYQSQNIMFFRVWFYQLYTAYQDSGTLNGDATKFFGCRFNYIYGRCIAFNNLQYVNVELFGCSLELIYGHCFYVAAGGGGALRMYGGSIIMLDGGAPAYIVYISAGAALGNNNNTYLIDGIQTQLEATDTGMCFIGQIGGQAPKVVFRGVNNTATNGARTTVSIIEGKVTFEDCVLTQNQGDTYQVQGPAAGGDQYGIPGEIEFIRCEVPTNFSSFCSTPVGGDGLAWGYITARDCFWSNYDSSIARTVRYAMDFDLNWQNGGRAQNMPPLKMATGYIQNRQLPDSSANFNWTVWLPANATIVKMLGFRGATTGGTTYTLNIGNGNQTTTYGSSSGSNTLAGTQTVSVDWTATPASWVTAGAWGSVSAQVQMWATTTASGAAAVGSNGYFFVWYY